MLPAVIPPHNGIVTPTTVCLQLQQLQLQLFVATISATVAATVAIISISPCYNFLLLQSLQQRFQLLVSFEV